MKDKQRIYREQNREAAFTSGGNDRALPLQYQFLFMEQIYNEYKEKDAKNDLFREVPKV